MYKVNNNMFVVRPAAFLSFHEVLKQLALYYYIAPDF